MKKLTAIIITTIFACAYALAGSVEISQNMVFGPVKLNPKWQTWAEKTVENITENGTLRNLGDIGHTLKPEYILQPKGKLDQNNVWTVVTIRGLNGTMFNLKQIKFTMSSAPVNALGSQVYDLSKISPVYSTLTPGYIWGKGDEGAPDTKVLNAFESGDTMVNSVTVIGIQCPYFEYSTVASDGALTSDFLLGYVEKNIRSITTVVEVSSGAEIIGHAERTIQSFGSPTTPKVAIKQTPSGKVLDFDIAAGNTGYLQSSHVLGNQADWKNELNLNCKGSYLLDSQEHHKFFRVTLLP